MKLSEMDVYDLDERYRTWNDELKKEIDDLKRRLTDAGVKEDEPVRNTTIQDVDVRVGIGGLTLDCERGCIWFSTGGMRKLVDFLTKAIEQKEKI